MIYSDKNSHAFCYQGVFEAVSSDLDIMRTFYIYQAGGPQNKYSVGVLRKVEDAPARLKGMINGEYNVRDALGGLRARYRVEQGNVTMLEKTK